MRENNNNNNLGVECPSKHKRRHQRPASTTSRAAHNTRAPATPSLKRLLTASFPYYYYCATTACAVEGFILPWNSNNNNNNNVNAAAVAGKSSFCSVHNGLGNTATTAISRTASTRLFSTSAADGINAVVDDDDDDFATSYHAPVMVNECLDALLDCERGRIRNPKPKSYKKKKKNKNKNKIAPTATTTTNSNSGDESSNNNTIDDETAAPKRSSLVFVDGTLGGGGHSNALLRRLGPGDVLFGCDVDPNALKTASERLSEYTNHDGTDRPLFIPVSTNFGDLAETLPNVLHPFTNEPILILDGGDDDDDGDGDDDDDAGRGVDGILLDLGVSSHQINEAERGFSFMRDGPLDMRMGSANGVEGGTVGGLKASDICNEFDAGELQRIFSVYGDEPRAKTVAMAIVKHRPLQTTGELAEAIASCTPKFARNKRHGQTATCARIFQSLRIIVNNEDGVLGRVLSEACPTLLRPGGRLVVMSYHSMEDRATKRIMRDGTLDKRKAGRKSDERDMYGNYTGPPKPFKPVQKQRKATEEETEKNPRARSAVLRVAERQDN